jgi:hypothetical protein
VIAAAGLSPRERRVVLALAGAAVVFRWLLAQRTPLPALSACEHLWAAQQLATHGAGALGELAAVWDEALWPLLLAAPVALGADAFVTAQVLAAVLGGVTVVLVALAAQRLRDGAGVPAAALAALASGPAVAAAAGSGGTLAAAFAAALGLAIAAGRAWLGVAAALGIALAPPVDVLAPGVGWPSQVRLGTGFAALAVPFAPRAVVPALRRRAWGLLVVLAVLAAGTAALVVAGALPGTFVAVAPLVAVLAGVALAPLLRWVRELLLAAAVALEAHAAWTSVEPAAARAERAIARYARTLLRPGERLASDLPRVLWAADQRPDPLRPDDADPFAHVAIAILGGPELDSWITRIPEGFRSEPLPADLADLAAERGLHLLIRRRRS